MRGLQPSFSAALVVATLLAVGAHVVEDGVSLLEEAGEKTPTAPERAAALAKVKALIAGPSRKSAAHATELAAKLKKAKALIAKYKLMAATATHKERIRLHAKLNHEKEMFMKKMRHAASYKTKLSKVAARAAGRVAAADASAEKYRVLLKAASKKASYVRAADKTISVLQNHLSASAKTTLMVAARVKKDDKTIHKLKVVNRLLKAGHKVNKHAKAKHKTTIEKQIKKQHMLSRAAAHRAKALHLQAHVEHKNGKKPKE